MAKALVRKLNGDNPVPVNMDVLVNILRPAVQSFAPSMKQAGILEDGWIQVDVLESKLKQVFQVTPVINFPIGTGKLSIMYADVLKFVTELKRVAEKEEVICLPCQS